MQCDEENEQSMSFHSVDESSINDESFQCDDVNETNDSLNCNKDKIFYRVIEDADFSNVFSDVTDISHDGNGAPCDNQVVNDNALKFIAQFYAKNDLPRNVVQEIINSTKSLISSNVAEVKTLVNNLKDHCEISNHVHKKLDDALSTISNPFKHLETEYQRFLSLSMKGVFRLPESFVCGRRGSVPLTGQYISIKQTLLRFFQMPNVFNQVQSYVNFLECETKEGVLSNFMQGVSWSKQKEDFAGKLVLPVFFHFDDVEVGNALGSHSNIHKLGALYASFPFLPPEFQSTLENIFLVLLFHSSDRQAENPFLEASNNKVMFNKIIQEIVDLRDNGICLEVDGRKIQIYFDLGLILGDNLGLHSILGFVESFCANFPCSLCKATKRQTESSCIESPELLRNPENYELDLLLNDVSQTGIKERCIWNAIPSFHVTNNLSADWMHDCLEGVCKYDILEILNDFVFESKLLKINDLQRVMVNHNYGDVSNTPPLITVDDLRKNNLRMSANEMLVFMQHLPSMLANFIPVGNRHWSLFLILYDIVLILMSPKLQLESVRLLGYLVTQHHLLYRISVDAELFENCSSVKFIVVNGTKYKIGTCLPVNVNTDGLPVFGTIQLILVNHENVCFVVHTVEVRFELDGLVATYPVTRVSNHKKRKVEVGQHRHVRWDDGLCYPAEILKITKNSKEPLTTPVTGISHDQSSQLDDGTVTPDKILDSGNSGLVLWTKNGDAVTETVSGNDDVIVERVADSMSIMRAPFLSQKDDGELIPIGAINKTVSGNDIFIFEGMVDSNVILEAPSSYQEENADLIPLVTDDLKQKEVSCNGNGNYFDISRSAPSSPDNEDETENEADDSLDQSWGPLLYETSSGDSETDMEETDHVSVRNKWSEEEKKQVHCFFVEEIMSVGETAGNMHPKWANQKRCEEFIRKYHIKASLCKSSGKPYSLDELQNWKWGIFLDFL
ncbi:3-phosphoshikimate 1-carboxyvinyltransferase [Frankliniella fusca]|uniref:3-phosphoshikimate 1-carboxyvinyltransferase n=1 Tax=Frankliniella fusca TaxID=407009 RepID=A0AAE1LSE3_9NEOP|nr:3-phosphoshikimate 1-carboxyvinyltransferase [Frankliniella fusca]